MRRLFKFFFGPCFAVVQGLGIEVGIYAVTATLEPDTLIIQRTVIAMTLSLYFWTTLERDSFPHQLSHQKLQIHSKTLPLTAAAFRFGFITLSFMEILN